MLLYSFGTTGLPRQVMWTSKDQVFLPLSQQQRTYYTFSGGLKQLGFKIYIYVCLPQRQGHTSNRIALTCFSSCVLCRHTFETVHVQACLLRKNSSSKALQRAPPPFWCMCETHLPLCSPTPLEHSVRVRRETELTVEEGGGKYGICLHRRQFNKNQLQINMTLFLTSFLCAVQHLGD